MNADVTQLLKDWRSGREEASSELWPLLHGELKQLANAYMRNQGGDHTLQATALVNEAFLKLVDVDFRGESRKEFLSLAASAMRSILVDHARRNARAKRGGDAVQVTLAYVGSDDPAPHDILQVDDMLTKLAAVDERMARIVELKVFGGLTYDEIAALLGVSSATVRADMRFGKAWLKREMTA